MSRAVRHVVTDPAPADTNLAWLLEVSSLFRHRPAAQNSGWSDCQNGCTEDTPDVYLMRKYKRVRTMMHASVAVKPMTMYMMNMTLVEWPFACADGPASATQASIRLSV